MWKVFAPVVGFGMGVSLMSLRAEHSTERLLLSADTSATHRALVCDILETSAISYRLKDRNIHVAPEDFDRATQEVSEEHLTDRTIYRFLDTNDITTTRWLNDRKWQVALQRKLQQLIEKMSAVESASVMLVPRVSDPLRLSSSPTSAIVVVEPSTTGGITPDLSAAIIKILTAVRDLPAERISIIDSSTSEVLHPAPER